jgi:AraC-like DNA-binding protein
MGPWEVGSQFPHEPSAAAAVAAPSASTQSASEIELARTIAISPHHLSRIFSECTGETISRYRNRVRVRMALERLADGETSLARLAADLGFADQAYRSRVVRREVGQSPSRLRESLAAHR